MRRVAVLLFLLAFTTGNRHLFAQVDEDLSAFYSEYTQVILNASKSGVKSLTFYVDEFADSQHYGDKTKVNITFLNDSVFEQKARFRKSTYVIRHGYFFQYDRRAKAQPEVSTLHAIDSAGCKIYRSEGYENMRDSSMLSYCRFMYDSLHRQIDYYYTFSEFCYHTITRYEGDTVSITEHWERRNDTMRLTLTTYRYATYNADSTFFIQHIRYSRNSPGSTSSGPDASDERRFITYDDQHRIIAVRLEEVNSFTSGHQVDLTSTLRVTYR